MQIGLINDSNTECHEIPRDAAPTFVHRRDLFRLFIAVY